MLSQDDLPPGPTVPPRVSSLRPHTMFTPSNAEEPPSSSHQSSSEAAADHPHGLQPHPNTMSSTNTPPAAPTTANTSEPSIRSARSIQQSLTRSLRNHLPSLPSLRLSRNSGGSSSTSLRSNQEPSTRFSVAQMQENYHLEPYTPFTGAQYNVCTDDENENNNTVDNEPNDHTIHPTLLPLLKPLNAQLAQLRHLLTALGLRLSSLPSSRASREYSRAYDTLAGEVAALEQAARGLRRGLADANRWGGVGDLPGWGTAGWQMRVDGLVERVRAVEERVGELGRAVEGRVGGGMF